MPKTVLIIRLNWLDLNLHQWNGRQRNTRCHQSKSKTRERLQAHSVATPTTPSPKQPTQPKAKANRGGVEISIEPKKPNPSQVMICRFTFWNDNLGVITSIYHPCQRSHVASNDQNNLCVYCTSLMLACCLRLCSRQLRDHVLSAFIIISFK